VTSTRTTPSPALTATVAVSPRAPGVADRARLRRLLLSRPWELSTDAAQWLADAGIRYVTGS
jgi:hypothetical protein